MQNKQVWMIIFNIQVIRHCSEALCCGERMSGRLDVLMETIVVRLVHMKSIFRTRVDSCFLIFQSSILNVWCLKVLLDQVLTSEYFINTNTVPNSCNSSCFIYSNGFNILLYGFGSKRKLIEQFRHTVLPGFSHLVINGYFPSLTVKHVSCLPFLWEEMKSVGDATLFLLDS